MGGRASAKCARGACGSGTLRAPYVGEGKEKRNDPRQLPHRGLRRPARRRLLALACGEGSPNAYRPDCRRARVLRRDDRHPRHRGRARRGVRGAAFRTLAARGTRRGVTGGQSILKRLGESSFWRRTGRVHAWLYHLTGGTIGHRAGGLRNLLLTTTGRRSGERRTVPLTYMADGDRYVLVASNGGADRHPAWWLNLERT